MKEEQVESSSDDYAVDSYTENDGSRSPSLCYF